jgi:hypothetical protein
LRHKPYNFSSLERRIKMIDLHDIIRANDLLMKLGGEDQLPKLTATAIERSLELQNRIDRALEYASGLPSNSMHAKKIASILDGVVTAAEVKAEVVKAKPKKPAPQKKTAGPGSRNSGLSSRPRSERLAFRNWARAQGMNVPTAGPVPQEMVDAYDLAQEEFLKATENPEASSE